MKIGFVQFAPALANLTATLTAIDRLAERAAGVDLLVLPELCNSGYNFCSRAQAWATSEELGDSPFLRHVLALCRRHEFCIVTGLNERAGERLFNSAVLVTPRGIVGSYRKLHLFMNERDYFQPGDGGLPVYDIGPCKIGMLVCFDWVFPEAWRILALKGSDVICHPSNLVLPGLAQRVVPAHAITNRVFVVTANRIGTEGSLTFTGASTIADPLGRVVAQAGPDQEEVAVVEIDLAMARDKQITVRNHLFGDRRPEEYRALLDCIPEQ